jgi:hypothetical protein
MVIYLIAGKGKSDCYYKNLDLGNFSNGELDEIYSFAKDAGIEIKAFLPNYEFEKNKYDYTEQELLELKNADFLINEETCNKRVLAPDGNIYFCPGLIELKEPICSYKDYDEQSFNELLSDFYFKKLHMCIGQDLNDIRRFCPIKSRCDKNMCYYLNQKITGEKRFPFSQYCMIKESKYKNKMEENNKDSNALGILLSMMANVSEALLSLGTANPDGVVKNRVNVLVGEINKNIELILDKAQGEQNGTTEGSR